MTRQNREFFGTWCPTITPFDDEGQISLPALGRHFSRLTASGINGILLMGSIGEFISLNLYERLLLIREARALSSLPMMVNISSSNMAEMLRLAEEAELCGYQAVVILPPYYFQQTPAQLLAYYRELGGKIAGKWLAYNFPARCGCSLDADLVRQLAEEFPNFVGLKDTVDCLSHTREIIQKVSSVRPDFAVFSGFDEYLIPESDVRGAGVISGLNNLCPTLFAEAIQAWKAGDMVVFNRIQQELGRLSAIYSTGNDFVTTIKTVLARQYHDSGPQSRNPAGELTAKDCQMLDKLFAQYTAR